MATIWKHTIDRPAHVYGQTTVMFPPDSKLISAAEQGGHIVVYAIVREPSAPPVAYDVLIAGTGKQSINDCAEALMLTGRFLGTVAQGPFMWHVFCPR